MKLTDEMLDRLQNPKKHQCFKCGEKIKLEEIEWYVGKEGVTINPRAVCQCSLTFFDEDEAVEKEYIDEDLHRAICKVRELMEKEICPRLSNDAEWYQKRRKEHMEQIEGTHVKELKRLTSNEVKPTA